MEHVGRMARCFPPVPRLEKMRACGSDACCHVRLGIINAFHSNCLAQTNITQGYFTSCGKSRNWPILACEVASCLNDAHEARFSRVNVAGREQVVKYTRIYTVLPLLIRLRPMTASGLPVTR